MSSLGEKIFIGGGIASGLITVGIQAFQNPADTNVLDKVFNVAASFFLVRHLAKRTDCNINAKIVPMISSFQALIDLPCNHKATLEAHKKTLQNIQNALLAHSSFTSLTAYLLAMPNYCSLAKLIYNAVSSDHSVDEHFKFSFNSILNSFSNSPSNATVQNQTFNLTNSGNNTDNLTNSSHSIDKQTNPCSLADAPNVYEDINVDEDINIPEVATLTAMAMPIAAASTVLAAAGIFAAYKYREHQKELRESQAQKARDAALRLNNGSNHALLEEEARRQKVLKDACLAVDLVKTNNEATLSGLGINFWHIPLSWPKEAKALGFDVEGPSQSNEAAPVFNEEKSQEVAKIKAQIEASLASHGKVPLPNLLLSGVPGVGKTMLIANLCKTSGIGYIKIPTGLLESKLTQNSSKETLDAIINVAKTSNAPVYVVLDDGEGLFDKSAANFVIKKDNDMVDLPWFDAGDRVNSNDVINKRRRELVHTLIEYAKGQDRKVSFALTTNRLNVVVDGFKEASFALDVPPPEKPERVKILAQGLTRVFGEGNQVLGYFTQERLKGLADKTEGFTGRNIIKMLETLYSLVNHDPNTISDSLIDNAVTQTLPSVERFRLQSGG